MPGTTVTVTMPTRKVMGIGHWTLKSWLTLEQVSHLTIVFSYNFNKRSKHGTMLSNYLYLKGVNKFMIIRTPLIM